MKIGEHLLKNGLCRRIVVPSEMLKKEMSREGMSSPFPLLSARALKLSRNIDSNLVFNWRDKLP